MLKLVLIGTPPAAQRAPHESAQAVFSSALSLLLFKSSAHRISLFVWSQISLPTSARGHRLQIDFELETERRVFYATCTLWFSDYFSTGNDELPACLKSFAARRYMSAFRQVCRRRSAAG